MAFIHAFSFPDDGKEAEEINKILRAKRKDRTLSTWVFKAIQNQLRAEETKTIDDFVQPNTELDLAPRVFEPITQDYLKTLPIKELLKLNRIVHYNKTAVWDYVRLLDARQDANWIRDKEDDYKPA